MRNLTLVVLAALSSLVLPACGSPQPRCGPENCVGCCEPSGVCAGGAQTNACGSQGASCQACSVSDTCSLGVCSAPLGGGGGSTGDAGTGGGVATGGGGAMGGGGGSGGGVASGCGSAGGPTGLLDRSVMAGGVARRYQLLVPTGHDGLTPMRLIFVFHGLGGDGDQIRSYFGFEAEAAGQALFVYPDGLVRLQGRTGWGVEDLPFFDAMVDDIAAHFCVDRARIFATGHSFGAYMSNQVACQRGNVVRALAVASGGLLGGACTGPVAAWLEHGTTDATVPQSEGLAARDHWLTANGCGTATTPVTPSPCVTYDGCSVGHPVTWCSFQGGHYPLPASGKQAIWDFLRAF